MASEESPRVTLAFGDSSPAVQAISEIIKWWESKDHSDLDLAALHKIMARDPAVQAMVLRAAARIEERGDPFSIECEILADAVANGEIKLEIPE